jgi:hypothetical protein
MPPAVPDYSQLIEGLAAVSLGIEELAAQLSGDRKCSADVAKLVRAQTLMEQATELLLMDLRERDLV